MIAIVPILVALLGLLLYALPLHVKVNEIGRLLFFAGIVVALLHGSTHAVRVL